MRFPEPLMEGRLLRRYKRFLADVELLDGSRVTAHCPNPGAMTSSMREGGRVWLSRSDNPARKLAHTWELAEVADTMICVNTGRANDLVAEALAQGRIPELSGHVGVRREVRYGERSRVDFVLDYEGGARCYLEVKSVSLDGGGGVAAFPDSVTVRGRRHLEELMEMVRQGHRAVLLFVCNRTDSHTVRPADEVDPHYGYTLRRARDAGVEILAYRSALDPEAMALDAALPVHLPALDFQPPREVRVGGKKRARIPLGRVLKR